MDFFEKFFVQFILLALCLLMTSCQIYNHEQDNNLFQIVHPSESGIDFQNKLTFRSDFNIYRYRNFYNGGGVALGDINNDNLLDIFFTSNMENNKLYLNKGNLTFEDISQKAGIKGQKAWSTGVSMADVNGDGLLDIYVCNSGIVEGDDKRNELYINNGDSTFTEKAAEYGVDDNALSIHGSFFDYDRDGDLDLYLVNNSFRAIGSFDQSKNMRHVRDPQGGDKLYRNDDGHFTDVSAEAGIYGSAIGFGLGVSVEDVNRDGWPDLYISNDFFERDYLYINNRDGTFSEVLEEQIKSISAAAMGGDIADLNADGYPEIFITDMLPQKESRLKKVTTFDNWERYRKYVRDNYHHQFTRNTLQLNNGNGSFSEVGRYAGVEATDWSWGGFLADFNLDGRRDIFTANGIYQDITDLDYLKKISRRDMVRKIVTDSTVNFKRLVDMIPSSPIPNKVFSNRGNMQFADSTARWGLDKPLFSNGSAYGDLDNDGDPDLVLNNLESTASVYENRATELAPGRNWLRLQLKGEAPNTDAIGTQVTAWADGRKWYAGQFPVRGFQATVDQRILLGLGQVEILDSLIVDWFNSGVTKLTNVQTNKELVLDEADAEPAELNRNPDLAEMPYSFREVTSETGVRWQHNENKFIDFKRDLLAYHMRSTEGPPICAADVNSDGLEDFYAGGAKGQAGAIFLQQNDGTFQQDSFTFLKEDAISEDTDCIWFDADGDGRQDLYVTSGGNEFPASSSALADRLYLQQENGNFSKADLGIPDWRYKTAGSISPADFDGDGDVDLFLGVRLQPFALGMPTNGYLLRNDGDGNFTDVTDQIAPDLKDIGMITDSKWGDLDGDDDPDLLIAGEWMPLTVFENDNGKFTPGTEQYGLQNTSGWWKTILLEDLDGDGDLDFVAGNHGLNSRFHASEEYPVDLWINDFDESGSIDPIVSIYKNGEAYPMALRHDLIEQLPNLESKYPTFESYAGQTLRQIIPEKKLKEGLHKSVVQLASVVGWNEDGAFKIQKLPMQGQLTPIYSIYSSDLNSDGKKEIITGGNLYNVDPEVGRYAAGYGSVFSVNGDSLVTAPANTHGLSIDGQIREIKSLKVNGLGNVLLIARNNDGIKFYKTSSE